MNYEEKYKEALKIMESLHNVVKYQSSSDALLASQTIEKAFPELRESEDERIRKALIRFFSKSAEYDSSTNGIKDRNIIAWLKKQGEQKPSWSEEDEEMYDAVIADIQFTQKTHNHEVNQIVYEREIDWFKSLKDRIQPQPKQEWSDEDEENLNNVVKELDITKRSRDKILYAQYDKLIDWLQSIKSNHWKPSEEQMKALCNVAFEFGNSCLSPYSDNNKELVSLYNDLLKL